LDNEEAASQGNGTSSHGNGRIISGNPKSEEGITEHSNHLVNAGLKNGGNTAADKGKQPRYQEIGGSTGRHSGPIDEDMYFCCFKIF